jgi:GntR family transcriptional regulator, arabinose operon transcriptional repressor
MGDVRPGNGEMGTEDEKKPKYQTIGEEIRNEIRSRRLAPGQRLPSDSDLAQRFDASRLTVIRALRDLETEGVVQRKAGSGTFVAERQSVTTCDFGILMPDLAEGEVFDPISQGIARAGEVLHHRILWGNLGPSDRQKEEYALELCRYFIGRKVAGVFFAPVELSAHQKEVNERIVSDLELAGIRIVLVDRCIRPFPERSRYDLAAIDNYRAGHRMTTHLLDNGCRRPVFAYRAGSAPTVAARLAGYREALWSAGLSSAYFTFEIEGSDSGALTRLLADAGPDGFVCANDLTAAKLMHRLLGLGVRIPQDVRMVGINDVKYARFLPVPLTTLRQPCHDIGFAAMEAMLQRLERNEGPPRDILLDCELVIRQSCGSEGKAAAQ